MCVCERVVRSGQHFALCIQEGYTQERRDYNFLGNNNSWHFPVSPTTRGKGLLKPLACPSVEAWYITSTVTSCTWVRFQCTQIQF